MKAHTTDRRTVITSAAPFRPRRAASFWSSAEDLLWPEKRARDKIARRVDALADAGVDTVVQFGFHCRFDFAWYFGAIHGFFAELASSLHERGIRFLDHYSCNVVARPRSEEERVKYHSFQRHHVDLYPDRIAAESASYAGYRFNDLCEVDLSDGGRAYTSSYQAELFCHNNPDFLAMHEAYLKRQIAEIPMDGLQQDDMAFYNFFRSCGCRHCRERFSRDYGRDLPPLSEKGFWGDTTLDPRSWGNYESPAFRDWVRMRYDIVSDHLAMVKRVIGAERMLMTCCSNSGPQVLNSLALSYEHFIEHCDWVMLENCGLAADTVAWARMDPEAVLHKSIGLAKRAQSAPAVALSYTVYHDGAYLGWALARFWGVVNWVSTLRHGLVDDPTDPEEAELIARYNRWELETDGAEPGADLVEARLVFLGANKENGVTADDGNEYWLRMKGWALALLERNVTYRFVTGAELAADASDEIDTPLIFDSSACIGDDEFAGIERLLEKGGRIVVVGAFGTHDERGNLREIPLATHLETNGYDEGQIVRLETADTTRLLERAIASRVITPAVVVTGAHRDRRIRLRRGNDGGVVLHLLNASIEGVPHPTATDRWGKAKVLDSIRSAASGAPLELELDATRLGITGTPAPTLLSPELAAPRETRVTALGEGRFRVTVDLSGIRLYAVLR